MNSSAQAGEAKIWPAGIGGTGKAKEAPSGILLPDKDVRPRAATGFLAKKHAALLKSFRWGREEKQGYRRGHARPAAGTKKEADPKFGSA